VQITSLRVAIHEKFMADETAKLRLNELDNAEEKRLKLLTKDEKEGRLKKVTSFLLSYDL
jgi:hypothetical protein